MSRIRARRRNIALDMTTMCDMAFLLLAFFMLATKFKPNESASVNTPSSISAHKMPEANIMVISVEPSGTIFFGLAGEKDREKVLDRISSRYHIAFTQEEKMIFSHLASFGTSVSRLKALLSATPDERKKMEDGIPADSSRNELREWVKQASLVNNKMEVAIKADKDVQYPVMESIIETLRDLNINKFKFVTTLEAK